MECRGANVYIRCLCCQVLMLLGYAGVYGRIDRDGVGLLQALSEGYDMFVLLFLRL